MVFNLFVKPNQISLLPVFPIFFLLVPKKYWYHQHFYFYSIEKLWHLNFFLLNQKIYKKTGVSIRTEKILVLPVFLFLPKQNIGTISILISTKNKYRYYQYFNSFFAVPKKMSVLPLFLQKKNIGTNVFQFFFLLNR